MKLLKSQTGFTIVELMISTTVFSIFLFLLTTMTIRVGRLYTKGIISAKTQEAARSVVTDIGRAIQFSGSTPTWDATHICAGSQRYTFTLGFQLKETGPYAPDQTNRVLVADNPSSCPAGAATNPQRELVGENMRLAKLTISGDPLTGLYTIGARVVYGDFAYLDDPTGPTAQCTNGPTGTQFCAASEFSTTIQKRL